MRGALLGALVASPVCCDPEPAAPDSRQQAPPDCGDATLVTRQDEFMSGVASAGVSLDVGFMRDPQDRLVLVTSGSNLDEIGWDYDQLEDHVYFKLVEPPPDDRDGPFFPEDSELIISSVPGESQLGYKFESYHTSDLPRSIALWVDGPYGDRESQPSYMIFADVLSRVEAGSHLVMGVDEPDAILEPGGGQEWAFGGIATGSPADGVDRSLLLLEYVGPDCDPPWDMDRHYALFRDVAPGTSTTADAELIIEAPPNWNPEETLVPGDMDGDGLTDLVVLDALYERIAAVPGGLTGDVALQDIARITRLPSYYAGMAYFHAIGPTRLIGGLDIDRDGLGDMLVGAGGTTIYQHFLADTFLGGCVYLYRGADLLEGRSEPWAVVAGDQPGEELSTSTLARCGSSHFCASGWDNRICDDEWGRGILYVVPAEQEGFVRVNDAAVDIYVGDTDINVGDALHRAIVGRADYDVEDGLLALGAFSTPYGDESMAGMIYLLSLDL